MCGQDPPGVFKGCTPGPGPVESGRAGVPLGVMRRCGISAVWESSAPKAGSVRSPIRPWVACPWNSSCVRPTRHRRYPQRIPLSTRAPPPTQLKIATVFGAFLDPVADKIMWVVG